MNYIMIKYANIIDELNGMKTYYKKIKIIIPI